MHFYILIIGLASLVDVNSEALPLQPGSTNAITKFEIPNPPSNNDITKSRTIEDPLDRLRHAVFGEPRRDYPVYREVPTTEFSCHGRTYGYYADVATRCQVFHVCLNGGDLVSMLCPNGTIFNQEHFTCDWWYNVDCSATEQLYYLNNNFGLQHQTTTTKYPDIGEIIIADRNVFHRIDRDKPKGSRDDPYIRSGPILNQEDY